MTAVRQKSRMPMTSCHDLRERRSLSFAGSRHLKNRTACVWCEQDDIFSAPGATSPGGSIGQNSRESAIDVCALERTIREETDRSVVRRPEGKQCPIRAGEGTFNAGVQRAQTELRAAL